MQLPSGDQRTPRKAKPSFIYMQNTIGKGNFTVFTFFPHSKLHTILQNWFLMIFNDLILKFDDTVFQDSVSLVTCYKPSACPTPLSFTFSNFFFPVVCSTHNDDNQGRQISSTKSRPAHLQKPRAKFQQEMLF